MKEPEHRHVALIEKHKLYGANTVTLKKHKDRYVTLLKSTRRDGVNMVAMMFSTPT